MMFKKVNGVLVEMTPQEQGAFNAQRARDAATEQAQRAREAARKQQVDQDAAALEAAIGIPIDRIKQALL